MLLSGLVGLGSFSDKIRRTDDGVVGPSCFRTGVPGLAWPSTVGGNGVYYIPGLYLPKYLRCIGR